MIGKDEFYEKMGVMFREIFENFVILPRFIDVQLPLKYNLRLLADSYGGAVSLPHYIKIKWNILQNYWKVP